MDQNIGQYIEDYIDLVENVPNEIVRQITQLHEKNHLYLKLLNRLERTIDKFTSSHSSMNADEVTKTTDSIHNFLVHVQIVSDEKLNLIQSIYDQLELKGRQLDFDLRNLKNGHLLSREISSREADFLSFVASSQAVVPNGKKVAENGNHRKGSLGTEIPPVENGRHSQSDELDLESTSGSPENHRVESNTKTSGSRRKQAFRKSGKGNGHVSKADSGLPSSPLHVSPAKNGRGVKRHMSASKGSSGKGNSSQSSRRSKRDTSPPSIYEEPNPVDPDEPTYCLCGQISFGEMICCDNTTCSLEWFHFQCVQLTTKPKGKWYCPQCRGDRSNLPKK